METLIESRVTLPGTGRSFGVYGRSRGISPGSYCDFSVLGSCQRAGTAAETHTSLTRIHVRTAVPAAAALKETEAQCGHQRLELRRVSSLEFPHLL